MSAADSLGARLRSLRIAAGFPTQRALADAAGVNQSTVALIETGRSRNPSYGTVERLAAALGVEAAELAEAQPVEEVAQDVRQREIEATRMSFNEIPALNFQTVAAYGNVVPARVSSDALTPLNICRGDVVLIDVGGRLEENQIVALHRVAPDEAFENFCLRRRVHMGKSIPPYHTTKGVIYMIGPRAPFETIIGENDACFRPTGPVVGLYRELPARSDREE